MKTELNNVVIECLSEAHGQEIKTLFVENGVDVGEYGFIMHKKDNDENRYYGVLNGKFSNYSIEQVKAAGARIVELPTEEIEQPRCELVPDFKVGDTVYCAVVSDGKTPLKVGSIIGHTNLLLIKGISEDDVNEWLYYNNGAFIKDSPPCLSHTPYDFINGGFSQRMKKVLPDIPVDTLVYVNDSINKWEMMYFAEWDNGKVKCWINQMKSHETNRSRHWNEWSLTNPLESK